MKILATITSLVFGFGLGAPILAASASNQQIIAGKAKVTDGDSIRIGDKRIRLFGIDAIESKQTCQLGNEDWACGRSARKALEKLIDGRQVSCVVEDMDRGRYVSVCAAEDTDINKMQVRNGWAVAYRKFSMRYVGDEIYAWRRRKGIWRSTFERPHDYRARIRQEIKLSQTPQIPPSTDCLIKGNISRSGVRIFHSPGQRDYKNTRINEHDGEKWFCTREAAEAAGWRAAKR